MHPVCTKCNFMWFFYASFIFRWFICDIYNVLITPSFSHDNFFTWFLIPFLFFVFKNVSYLLTYCHVILYLQIIHSFINSCTQYKHNSPNSQFTIHMHNIPGDFKPEKYFHFYYVYILCFHISLWKITSLLFRYIIEK